MKSINQVQNTEVLIWKFKAISVEKFFILISIDDLDHFRTDNNKIILCVSQDVHIAVLYSIL